MKINRVSRMMALNIGIASLFYFIIETLLIAVPIRQSAGLKAEEAGAML